jgi:hypothetical protein
MDRTASGVAERRPIHRQQWAPGFSSSSLASLRLAASAPIRRLASRPRQVIEQAGQFHALVDRIQDEGLDRTL